MAPAYRCAACIDQPNRCASCRERRAEMLRERRAAKRAEGTCSECHRKALSGMSRCKLHRRDNNARSGSGHVAARQKRRG